MDECTPLVTATAAHKGPCLKKRPLQEVALVISVIFVVALAVLTTTPWITPSVKAKMTRLATAKCTKSGPTPCLRSGLVGDPTRPGFATRRDANLILYDDFATTESLSLLWRPDISLFGDGNGGFAFYTDLVDNVAVEHGQLLIRPGLFADLGQLQTAVPNQTYHAADVMTGNCTPFPDCATYCPDRCTIADFSGCQRIGTPLVALNPATSGRLTTRDTFNYTYGRAEARIRLPRGNWLWPALWLMPVTDIYGPWPDSGEIDLVEARGNNAGYMVGGGDGGRDTFTTCLHYAGNPWWHTKAEARADQLLGCITGSEDCDWTVDFFTVGLYWSDVRMYAYVLLPDDGTEYILWDVNASAGFGPDDVPLGCWEPPEGQYRDQRERTPVQGPRLYVDKSSNKNAPFDQPFYLIISLAIGGEQNGCPDPNFWGENAIWCTEQGSSRSWVSASTTFWDTRKKWLPTWAAAKAKEREAFAVDWVKIWQ